MKQSVDRTQLDKDENSDKSLIRDRSQVEVSPNPLRPSKTIMDENSVSAHFAVIENAEEDLSEFEIHEETSQVGAAVEITGENIPREESAGFFPR